MASEFVPCDACKHLLLHSTFCWNTYTCTHIHNQRHTHALTYTLTHSHTHTHSFTYSDACTRAHTHTHTHTHTHSHTHTHTQGVGLNAQGLANAILFCAFTKQVREQLMNSSVMTWLRLKLCCKRKVIGDKHRFITSYSVRDETVQVLIRNGQTNYGSSVDDDQLTLTLTE